MAKQRKRKVYRDAKGRFIKIGRKKKKIYVKPPKGVTEQEMIRYLIKRFTRRRKKGKSKIKAKEQKPIGPIEHNTLMIRDAIKKDEFKEQEEKKQRFIKAQTKHKIAYDQPAQIAYDEQPPALEHDGVKYVPHNLIKGMKPILLPDNVNAEDLDKIVFKKADEDLAAANKKAEEEEAAKKKAEEKAVEAEAAKQKADKKAANADKKAAKIKSENIEKQISQHVIDSYVANYTGERAKSLIIAHNTLIEEQNKDLPKKKQKPTIAYSGKSADGLRILAKKHGLGTITADIARWRDEKAKELGKVNPHDELLADLAGPVKLEGQASGGVTIPDRPATTDVINKIMFKHKGFLGTVASDQIKALLPKVHYGQSYGLVMNLDPSSKGGSHWVAAYLTPQSLEYYDSFGRDPPKGIYDQLAILSKKISGNKLVRYKVNRIIFQKVTTQTCGWHCMLFLKGRFAGKPFPEVTGFSRAAQNEKDVIEMKKKYPSFAWV